MGSLFFSLKRYRGAMNAAYGAIPRKKERSIATLQMIPLWWIRATLAQLSKGRLTVIEKTSQKIIVFQQDNKGYSKIKGIERYAKGLFDLDIISIDEPLPPVLDDTGEYITSHFDADLVLDFLKHPDLSHDLAIVCRNKRIPVVASGKKHRIRWAHTPPT
jgi:hypothetical protein